MKVLVLFLMFALSSCGGEDDLDEPSCALSCGTQSTMRADVPTVGLACGVQPASCTVTYDDFSRVKTLSCRYANGKIASCGNVTYSGLGEITGGTCSGEGQTCLLP